MMQRQMFQEKKKPWVRGKKRKIQIKIRKLGKLSDL